MSNPSLTHSQLTDLATQFISAYNTCSTATPTDLSPINSVFTIRTPECTQNILPSSIGMPSMKNSEYRTFLEGIVKMGWEGMKMTTIKTICDTSAMRIVIHAKTSGMTPVGEYAQEYVFMLEVEKDGEGDGMKVGRVEEFVDSKFNDEFQGRLKIWIAEQEQKEKGS